MSSFSWLDRVFLALGIRDDGADLPQRSALNFIGCTVEDDEANDCTNVTPGGGETPTGTGVRKVISGVEDTAASLIVDADVHASAAIAASKVVQASGTGIPHVISGTLAPASSLIVDADVHATAAIAASKVVQASGTGIPHVVSGALSAASSLIVDADVHASAAIAASKVVQASGTGIPHVVSGALSAASSLIVNADVHASAAIDGSKLVAATASLAGSMSAADKGKLDGIQTQGASVAVPAMAIDWSAGSTFSKTLAGGANTFTFSNATDGQCIIAVVTGAASTLAWPTVKWAGGTVPTQTASGIDVYTFTKVGSTIYGSVAQAMA